MSPRRLRPGLRSVRGRATAGEVVRDARTRGMQPHLAGPASSKAELLDAVADALDFPGWTGRNWDALADALADLSWLPAGPHVLLWPAPGRLRAADPGAYRTAVEVLDQAAADSAGTARPLTVLLLPDAAPDLPGLPDLSDLSDLPVQRPVQRPAAGLDPGLDAGAD